MVKRQFSSVGNVTAEQYTIKDSGETKSSSIKGRQELDDF